MFKAFDILSQGDLDLLESVFERHETLRKKVELFKLKEQSEVVNKNIRSYMGMLYRYFDDMDYIPMEELGSNKETISAIDYIISIYKDLSEEVRDVFNNFFEGVDYRYDKVLEQ